MASDQDRPAVVELPAVAGSVLTFLGAGIRACVDCVGCIGRIGCVGLHGAVGQRGRRAA